MQGVSAWQVQACLCGVQRLPSRKGADGMREVQRLRARQGEEELRSVQPLPPWKVDRGCVRRGSRRGITRKAGAKVVLRFSRLLIQGIASRGPTSVLHVCIVVKQLVLSGGTGLAGPTPFVGNQVGRRVRHRDAGACA